ncbi:hypothetical protein [Paraburkholderia heleia]|uniref:hypothetical protein n=1 Tax=Paraburkholderia heleia TaxID=634127 RepID=UPI0005AA7B1A|nr:hypothetical protein [Paraburkholderia heleia]
MRQGQTALAAVAVSALAILVAGCANKQDLSEANLTDALNAYFAPAPGICLNVWHFPYQVNRVTIKGAAAIDNDPHLTSIGALEALKSAGLVMSHDVPNPPSSDGAVARTYDLTEAGSTAFTDAPGSSGTASSGARTGTFCYGHVHVTHVVKWDAPAMGETTAYFNYVIEGLPDWAKQPAIRRAYPKLDHLVQGSGSDDTASSAMRLTSNGWEVKH